MIIYDALAVDWQPQKTCFFAWTASLPMFHPSASAEAFPGALREVPASAQFAREFNLGDYLPFKIKKCTLNLGRGEPIHWVATWKTRLWTAVAGLQRRARNRRAYSEQQQKPRGGASQPKKKP